MEFIKENIWLILFFVWGLPLGIYRSRFRKIVYQTDSWLINIKPIFIREIKGLFGNLYPENKKYKRFRNFYLFYLAIYTILFILYFNFSDNISKNNDMNNIKVGSKVPEFSLHDQNGDTFDISSVLGKKNLVIYFYPKDDTPGCTAEACSFRDQYEVFREADAEIIGISSQSVESHFNFAKKYNLNYTLLSDTEKKVRKLFGVKGDLFGLIPGRVTYVANKKGEVIFVFDSQRNAEQHVDEALAILKKTK